MKYDTKYVGCVGENDIFAQYFSEPTWALHNLNLRLLPCKERGVI